MQWLTDLLPELEYDKKDDTRSEAPAGSLRSGLPSGGMPGAPVGAGASEDIVESKFNQSPLNLPSSS